MTEIKLNNTRQLPIMAMLIIILRSKAMVGSVGSVEGPGLATALMKQKTAEENLAVTMVKKAQDVEAAQGEAAVKLIQDAAPGKVDVYA